MKIRHKAQYRVSNSWIDYVVGGAEHNECGWSDLYPKGERYYGLGDFIIFHTEGSKEYEEIFYKLVEEDSPRGDPIPPKG